MLRITVELDKGGFDIEREVIGTAFIRNDGTGTTTSGNYTFDVYAKKQRIKSGRLVGFKRSKNVWWLLFYCLKVVFWEQAVHGELYRNGSPQSFKRLK